MFLHWIQKLKTLLFGDKFLLDDVISDMRTLESGEYKYFGLFEARNYDKQYEFSSEENQIFSCIEQLHLLR